MYLHIGNGKSIRKNKIIGIFDLDTATVSQITKKYINRMQKEERLDYDAEDLPRSFVLYEGLWGQRVLLSRISTQGLKLRATGKITDTE